VDELHSGNHVSPTQTTLSEWAIDSWLPMMAARIKPSTLHSYRRNLEIHVLPVLGGKPLQQITPVMLNTLYANLASQLMDARRARRVPGGGRHGAALGHLAPLRDDGDASWRDSRTALE
jgi:hypothetical protein